MGHLLSWDTSLDNRRRFRATISDRQTRAMELLWFFQKTFQNLPSQYGHRHLQRVREADNFVHCRGSIAGLPSAYDGRNSVHSPRELRPVEANFFPETSNRSADEMRTCRSYGQDFPFRRFQSVSIETPKNFAIAIAFESDGSAPCSVFQ